MEGVGCVSAADRPATLCHLAKGAEALNLRFFVLHNLLPNHYGTEPFAQGIGPERVR